MIHNWISNGEWFGNSTLAWLIAAGAALLGYAIAHAIAVLLRSRLATLAQRKQRSGLKIAAGVAAATRGWLLLLIAITIALNFLVFDPPVPHRLYQLLFALVGIQIAFWLVALVLGWLHRQTDTTSGRSGNAVMVGVLAWAIRFLIWVTLLLAILANANVNITAFIASLGVGGVAVALALQNVLTDLFASIAIGLDKPFEVGETIQFGKESGTVVKVGIKSTRIKAVSGEELAISNSILLKDVIHNLSRRQERRILFTFRLPFDTPRERIPDAVQRVRAIIASEPLTRFDRGFLAGFGEYGLDFEFVYYVLQPGYNVFVEIQQRINLAMLAAFDELGIKLAVPARKLDAGASGGDAATVQLGGSGD